MKKVLTFFVFSIIFVFSAVAEPFDIKSGGLVISFDLYQDNILKNRMLLPEGYNLNYELLPMQKLSELEVTLHVTGQNKCSHAGVKTVGSMPGTVLQYHSLNCEQIQNGERYIITLFSPDRNIKVESIYEFFTNTNCVRRYSKVYNLGKETIGIECLSSAMVNNIASLGDKRLEDKLSFYRAYTGWQAEARWVEMTPYEMGYGANGTFQLSPISISNTGSFSSVKELPMGVVTNTEAGLSWFWQIEHNGSWHFEFGDVEDGHSNPPTYMYLGGPDDEHHNAWKKLKPGQMYQSIPVAVGCVEGGFDEAVASLTKYRRSACLKPHKDNEAVPVIFNDYMNCLFGDPTPDKEFPLIRAAAKAGCDYYVIDAGWYAERNSAWWDETGLWLPTESRWPDGIESVLDTIRHYNMIPGLWLEIERVGMNSPLKSKPDDWFYCRHGKRVISNSSYLLDFRNPSVVKYANSIIDRLVGQYKIGYIKMDYNINIGVGTDVKACSPGQGMLEAQRAYLSWLDSIYKKYPDLVIENCGSGGCRMDYAMLSRHQIQSSSDQTDYRKYPAIITGAMAAVLPEQLATWSYPMIDSDPICASFNMVSSMLNRIHQSGHLAQLREDSFQQVANGISIYKSEIAPRLSKAVPFFPLGFSDITDNYSPVALGLRTDDVTFIAVWRLAGDPIVEFQNIEGNAEILYPSDLGVALKQLGNHLSVSFPQENMACIIKITR